MKNFLRSAFACCILIQCTNALNRGRDYDTNVYYVAQIADVTILEETLTSVGGSLEHSFQELVGHHLISVPRSSGVLHANSLRKRAPGLMLLEEQYPRQRHKRGSLEVTQGHQRDHILRLRDEQLNPGYIQDIENTLSIHDPMFPAQWHLYNREHAGHDINVTGVWAQGITGKDTVVALVDDGIDMNSLDLVANYYGEGSYDFNDHNPYPIPKLSDDYHGTRCAGEIAAMRNDVCGVGIAYEARVSGLRILSGRITDADEAISLNYDFHNNLIYSCSWGPPDNGQAMEAPGLLIKRAIVNGIRNGRNGKGSIFVFASGNGALYDDNCNFDGYTNSIFSITIGGIDHLDQHPYYSELCAPQLAVTYSSGAGEYIHTTDVGENTCCDRHGGTSAAAPIGAGIFALVLSIRPDLTWRDLQYLCVETAVPFNHDDEDWQDTPAGFRFNHKFGFGKLDAYAMVEKAKVWSLVQAQSWYHSPVINIEEALGTEPHQQITSYFDVTEKHMKDANLKRLEHITVTINISHQRRGDVTVDLISPLGIISNLATVRRHDTSTEGFVEWTFMTVKHWGESGAGQWRLIVGDHDNIESVGTFHGWRMTFWGESIDESKAVPLPMPGEEPATEDQNELTTVSAPIAVSTAHPDKVPSSPTAPTDAVTPVRPVVTKIGSASTTHHPLPTTVIQPLPEETNDKNDKFQWNSRKALWIYAAISIIVAFVASLSAWLIIQRRREMATSRDGYEFKELNAEPGRSASAQEPAGELYDAFASTMDDSEEDDISQDSLDELDPLHK